MSTVSKEIADKVASGEYQEDGWVRIIQYTNAWGGKSYGLESPHTLGKYHASDYVINPVVYWDKSREGFRHA